MVRAQHGSSLTPRINHDLLYLAASSKYPLPHILDVHWDTGFRPRCKSFVPAVKRLLSG